MKGVPGVAAPALAPSSREAHEHDAGSTTSGAHIGRGENARIRIRIPGRAP